MMTNESYKRKGEEWKVYMYAMQKYVRKSLKNNNLLILQVHRVLFHIVIMLTISNNNNNNNNNK